MKITNMYTPNTRGPKYMKETLTNLKGRILESTIVIVREYSIFNNVQNTRQNIYKEIQDFLKTAGN